MNNQNQIQNQNQNQEIENKTFEDDFDIVKELSESNRENIYEIEQNLKLLKKELKEIKNRMQSVCKHEFVREVVTSGPYRELAYICKKCNYWN